MKTLIIVNTDDSNVAYIERLNGENISYDSITGDELISSGNAHSILYEGSVLETEKNSDTERAWRNEQLSIADIEIFKAEDLAGSFNALDWRAYRKDLRNWPINVDFPDKTKRPVSP